MPAGGGQREASAYTGVAGMGKWGSIQAPSSV